MDIAPEAGLTLPEPVAVIGAGGFLGINLARTLATHVSDLRCFGRRLAFPEALASQHWIYGDAAEDAVEEALVGCRTVIHLASTSTPTTADRDIAADAQANVVASLRLFDRCAAAGVRRLVFVSSGGTVYGAPAVVPTPESAPTLPITAYGVAKLALEKYLEVYRRQRGLDYRVLRVANLYGPFQTAEKRQGVVAAFLERAMCGQPLEIWGDGRIVRDYVYVADVVAAVMAAMRHEGEPRVFNIGSGGGLNLLEVAAAVEALLGTTVEKRFHEGRPVDVPISILDSGLALRELGWRPQTSFIEGLRLTAEWMKSRSHVQHGNGS